MKDQRKSAARFGIRFLDSTLDLLILIAMLLLLVFGLYVIWDTSQLYTTASSNTFQQYKPTAEALSLEEIQELNSDVFAWLTIYGTSIDFPVVKGETNESYINTDVFGKYSLSGSIFLDYRNQINFVDFNSIIYGHHMEKQAMFGEIDTFADEAVFNEKQYGNLFYDGKDHGLEIYAYLDADAYDFQLYHPAARGEGLQKQYLRHLRQLAVYRRDMELTPEDKIVLLSTCSATSTNGRNLLVCKITDETFADPFFVEEPTKEVFKIDELGMVAIFGVTPDWFWLLLFIVLLTVLLVVTGTRHYRRKKRRERRLQQAS